MMSFRATKTARNLGGEPMSPDPPGFLADARNDRPLVLIGGLAPDDRDRVREFALRLNAPVYAEPLSGLREDADLAALHLCNERLLGRAGFTGVIRIGNVPTLRFWRDLDEKFSGVTVVSYSALPFRGLSRGDVHALEELPRSVSPVDRDEDLFARDGDLAERLDRILDVEPESELALVRALSRDLPHGARIYLGNSLPIREWDLVATRQERGFTLEANRGANGIDGQLSTFLGWCSPSAPNVAIAGDLTALYDLNAPWILPQLDSDIEFQVYIINNGGGRIFSRVPSLRSLSEDVRERLIENSHSLSFEHWAAMWSLAYNNRDAGRAVIEIVPDPDASRRVWNRFDELWS
jgi:2-succinyl-5-enolpyruvyl-6-hydroxy-3-cyclohexene-1-carboxylate synthase